MKDHAEIVLGACRALEEDMAVGHVYSAFVEKVILIFVDQDRLEALFQDRMTVEKLVTGIVALIHFVSGKTEVSPAVDHAVRRIHVDRQQSEFQRRSIRGGLPSLKAAGAKVVEVVESDQFPVLIHRNSGPGDDGHLPVLQILQQEVIDGVARQTGQIHQEGINTRDLAVLFHGVDLGLRYPKGIRELLIRGKSGLLLDEFEIHV